ncbi:RloB family protein [Pectobacterium sp. B2J-2]|uniref:RloB family protein n=1 Tax=Pectobacterium sp. B2J-2 TaxID=3385372 RepID=UPI0038FD1994
MGRVLKSPKKMMHILCEGEKTEPMYLLGYIENFAKDKAKIINVPDVKKNTPVQLVDEAIKLKDSNVTSPDDEIWVVYDRESISKYPHRLHAQAWDKATANKINIALSNICFELWILQHFEYTDSPFSCFDDLLNNSKLKDHLKNIGIHNYHKGDPHFFDKIKGGVSYARKRAAALNRSSLAVAGSSGSQPFVLSSYVGVHLLLDAIDNFIP